MFSLNNYIGPILIFVLIMLRMVRKQQLKDSFKGIIIIIAIGLYSLYKALPSLSINFSTIIAILISCLTGIIFGMIRGATVHIYQDNETGIWMRQGTIITIGVFILGLVVNESLAHILVTDANTLSGVTQTLHMGLSILAGRIVHLNKRAMVQGRR